MRLVIASPLVAARFGSDLTHDLSGPPPSSNSVGYLCSGYFVTCSHHWIGSGDGARTSPSTSASRQYANRSSSNSRCLAENEANGRHSRISSMPSSAPLGGNWCRSAAYVAHIYLSSLLLLTSGIGFRFAVATSLSLAAIYAGFPLSK